MAAAEPVEPAVPATSLVRPAAARTIVAFARTKDEASGCAVAGSELLPDEALPPVAPLAAPAGSADCTQPATVIAWAPDDAGAVAGARPLLVCAAMPALNAANSNADVRLEWLIMSSFDSLPETATERPSGRPA
jgi:hypothetical protein